MKFELTLSEEDYLNLSLFISSKSSLTKKRRRGTLVILYGAFVMIAVSSYLSNAPIMPWWMVLIIGLLFVALYTIYQRRVYYRHYQESNAEIYKHRFDKTSTIEFLDDQLLTHDYTGESRSNLQHLEQIYETGSYYFAKFKTGEALILPKNGIPESEVRKILKVLSDKYELPYTTELNWKFK